MPEHLKALVVVLVLASASFALARQPLCAVAIAPTDFDRRRNLWLGLTLIAFLAHSFWLYVIVGGILLFNAVSKDSNRVGLYFFLLFAIPPFSAEITGLGIIKHFFAIDYIRLLALTVLLPAALILRRNEVKAAIVLSRVDKILLAYVILNLILQLFAITFTSVLRNSFYAFIDILLPYYVVSRSLHNLKDFRDALMSFSMAAMIMAVLGAFEFGWRWLLYRSLDGALGLEWDYGRYLDRGDTLRALVTTGQPIAMGYVMAVAFGFFLFLKKSFTSQVLWMVGMTVIVIGEIVPVSRGPWLGTALILLVFIGTGAHAMPRLAKLGLLVLVALPILFSTSLGEKVIDILPFVGSVDEGNVTYRQRLFDICMQIILDNPFFGSSDFLRYLEELRQGQGIIDIVNSYLIIALNCGLIGLSLFLSFFGSIAIGIFRKMRCLGKEEELHQLGQVLIAVIVGILFTIFTVSPITVVPVVYWSVAGLGAAYVRLATMEGKA